MFRYSLEGQTHEPLTFPWPPPLHFFTFTLGGMSLYLKFRWMIDKNFPFLNFNIKLILYWKEKSSVRHTSLVTVTHPSATLSTEFQTCELTVPKNRTTNGNPRWRFLFYKMSELYFSLFNCRISHSWCTRRVNGTIFFKELGFEWN